VADNLVTEAHETLPEYDTQLKPVRDECKSLDDPKKPNSKAGGTTTVVGGIASHNPSNVEPLKAAMSLYLYVLKLMRDTMHRAAEMRRWDVSSVTAVEIMNRLSKGLSLRFQELVKRAECCSQILASKTGIELHLIKTYPAPEPIIYHAALNLAKEASVGEVLGNLEQACRQYEKARILVECIINAAESFSDKKILHSFLDIFVRQHEQCKKLNEAF
jgi:hypothetical protein